MFAVIIYRFYIENITQLRDIITVELFFLNAKSAVYNVSVCGCIVLALGTMKNHPASLGLSEGQAVTDDSLSLAPRSNPPALSSDRQWLQGNVCSLPVGMLGKRLRKRT